MILKIYFYTHLNSSISFIDSECDKVVLLQQISFINQTSDSKFMLGCQQITIFIFHLNQTTIHGLIRIDATQWANNYSIVNAIQNFWMIDCAWEKEREFSLKFHSMLRKVLLTSRQQTNIFGRNTISRIHAIARCQ